MITTCVSFNLRNDPHHSRLSVRFPLLKMKALKATGILLGYILCVGLFIALFFGCLLLFMSFFTTDQLNSITAIMVILAVLYLPWISIYDSL